MEAYPADYVVHNLPFILLSGLESAAVETPFGETTQEFLGNGGFRIRADLPPLHHPLKDELRAALLAYDNTNAPWHPPSPDQQSHVYRIRSVGRAYTFPPRKAPPPPHSPRMRPSENGSFPAPLTLHSTLSPLSPSSPLYPDGIISPVWITKHQHRLPSVLIAFYNLVADVSTSSLEDNKIKNEVNAIRNVITSTNYKTRFVIVLVADGSLNSNDLEDRLVNIRRGTNFDSKALYFLPSSATSIEVKDFARVLLSTVHPAAIEYYRDLSKHARRKRNRNTVPQPTVLPSQATSALLPLQGWNVRYEFKLGIFAETRQELEAASKNYEVAYEGLYHAELLTEAIPAWSGRFNEARMLADVIALRMIRCFLWVAQSNNAVKWWCKHRDRMQDLVERRGKGTRTYGWEAWQATWAKVMAELVQRSRIFPITLTQLPPGSSPLMNLPPKFIAGVDRQLPWEHLHHEGYWLDRVRKHLLGRQSLAEAIPEDVDPLHLTHTRSVDASAFDTYLCPDPATERQLLSREGDSYAARIDAIIAGAVEAFATRDQVRMIEALQFSRLTQHDSSSDWAQVATQLSSLSQKCSWQAEGWQSILIEVQKSNLLAASKAGDQETICRTGWELSAFPKTLMQHNQERFETDISTAIDLQSSMPVVTASLTFSSDTSFVGEPIAAQVVLQSQVEALPFSLEIAELKITFDGGLYAVLIGHQDDDSLNEHSATIQSVNLSPGEIAAGRNNRLSLKGNQHSRGEAHLHLQTARTRILNLDLVPFEAGPVSVASITVLLNHKLVELSLYSSDVSNGPRIWWETRNSLPTARDFGSGRDVTAMSVLPKPPKLEIKVPDLADTYYTNESLDLNIVIDNQEEDAISGEVSIKLLSPPDHTAKLMWKHDAVEATSVLNDVRETTLSTIQLTGLAHGAQSEMSILLSELLDQCEHGLEITATYLIGAKVDQPKLIKSVTLDIAVIRPFEANASFLPRHHEESWPNFFVAPDRSDKSQGLKQQYLAKLDIGCFARTPLTIASLELVPRRVVGKALCTAVLSEMSLLPVQVESEKTVSKYIDLTLQKQILGDRAPLALDLALDIQWSRPNSSKTTTSRLLLPRFMAPMAEPRVLLRVHKLDYPHSYRLDYTLENSSMHFLTFTLALESGEGFAFSGAKSTSVSLTPISRVNVPYRILMSKSQQWVRIHLEVIDAFFGQTLRIQPASDGIMVDKNGQILVWAD